MPASAPPPTPLALPWTIYSDGSAIPNPGRMGLGAVLTAPDGARHTLSVAPHGSGCNNEAELRALIAALEEARKRDAAALNVYCDNSIVVEQLGDPPPPPIERLAALFDEARTLVKSFDSVSLAWIPRRRNGEADALARAALGMAPKPAARKKSGKRRNRR